MIDLHDIRYVHLGTPDLDSAVEFATKVVGLQQARRDGNRVYLRGDNRDHTLCYFEGDPADHTVGFEVSTADMLEAAGAELDNAGHRVDYGRNDACDTRRCQRFITFRDPSGNRIELVWRPQDNGGRRYFPTRDAGITDFSHVGLCSTDPVRDEAFWTRVCNARVSDWIGDAPLLRIDEVHHKIALFPSKKPGIQHINHQVAGIDDIMRAWYFLKERGVRIVFGPGRHPTSGAMFLYFEGPHGMIYEYSTGVSRITDEDGHRPRQFPFTPEGFCMWGSKPDIAEFRD
ncbi:glyoxalase/bleomycin resistance/extradiol dioxygenase family protein [Azospirillum sp. RWY-5-1]|uniref:Glyoxalase/bleomycin resistance/extradiol dioxygenase family protein n=1 Tax=Azospirillum oleiclasticum TaxID=2735135 RepID=A0ABX2T2B5_9PROT|nr:VOC family protein [Azospirillum oleiclasticum]NYZ11285.1 glyoxalase/bleomycin resistance/extradiol dioxygenase family protein [Azospirillum oleiclasticum]NYZ18446.1 glyoxalase/bleomycin resistance/extradiol dioxygenase family protein [Azospirillum oleiclasticum]